MTQHNSSKPRPVKHEEADPVVDEGQAQKVTQVTSHPTEQLAEQIAEQIDDLRSHTEAPSKIEQVFSSQEPEQTVSSLPDRPEETKTPVLGELALGEQWRCILCDQIEVYSSVRCGSCNYWRAELSSNQPLNTNAVHSRHVQKTPDKASDDEVLETAFARLQKLFTRAQKEGRTLGDAERASLYEALLLSLFKIERASIKKVMLKDFFRQEREDRRRAHMIHLSIIWFLGICTGFALYFGLQSVGG
jgi:hypothetical protein